MYALVYPSILLNECLKHSEEESDIIFFIIMYYYCISIFDHLRKPDPEDLYAKEDLIILLFNQYSFFLSFHFKNWDMNVILSLGHI